MYSLFAVAPDIEEEKEQVMYSRSTKIGQELISKQKHQTNVLNGMKIPVKKAPSLIPLTNLASRANVEILSFQFFFPCRDSNES